MANKRKFSYRSPQEDEYIYNNLLKYPEWAKKDLTATELRIFKTPTSIRAFVNNATSDQKMLILAKANIHVIKLYVDMNQEEPLNLQNFNKIYKQFANVEKRTKIIKEIQAKNTFAVSTREVLSSAYLIAQNCHTPYWFVNMDYNKVFNALQMVKFSNLKGFDGKSTEREKLKEMNVHRDTVVKFFWSVLDAENFIRVNMKMSWVDVNILLPLFFYRDTMLERSVILKLLSHYAPAVISNKLGSMVRDGYLDFNRNNHKKPCYTIAELGILKISTIVERIASQATNV